MKNDTEVCKYSSITKEKSCGAVVFKLENKTPLFLLVKHTSDHWSFPKGHIENKETEVETAIREIKEEVNIDVKIDKNFREVSTYTPYEGVIKDVVFFVGKALNDAIELQKNEVIDFIWANFIDAKNIITYQIDVDILCKAYKYIIKEHVM